MKRSLKIKFFLVQVVAMVIAFACRPLLASHGASILIPIGLAVGAVVIISKNFTYLKSSNLVMNTATFLGTIVQLVCVIAFTVITLASTVTPQVVTSFQIALVACWILSSAIVWFAAKKAIRYDWDIPHII